MVECTGLENRRTFTGTGGSNPSSSAILAVRFRAAFFLLLLKIMGQIFHKECTLRNERTVRSEVLPKLSKIKKGSEKGRACGKQVTVAAKLPGGQELS